MIIKGYSKFPQIELRSQVYFNLIHRILNSFKYSIQHYWFVCTQLNDSKYCYVILCTQLNGSIYSKWLNSSVWPIDEILTGAMTRGQSEPGSNVNERYSAFSKDSGLDPHQVTQFSVILELSVSLLVSSLLRHHKLTNQSIRFTICQLYPLLMGKTTFMLLFLMFV